MHTSFWSRGKTRNPCTLARFEIFMAAEIHVEVLCVVRPYSVVVGYQHFREILSSIRTDLVIFMKFVGLIKI
jgi:hypothetical protein